MKINCGECGKEITIQTRKTLYCKECVSVRKNRQRRNLKNLEYNFYHPENVNINSYFLTRGKISTRGFSLEYK